MYAFWGVSMDDTPRISQDYIIPKSSARDTTLTILVVRENSQEIDGYSCSLTYRHIGKRREAKNSKPCGRASGVYISDLILIEFLTGMIGQFTHVRPRWEWRSRCDVSPFRFGFASWSSGNLPPGRQKITVYVKDQLGDFLSQESFRSSTLYDEVHCYLHVNVWTLLCLI